MSEEMTREQAIKWLKTFKGNTGMTELSQAFDVAIAALSEEPCEDAISRREAIECVTYGAKPTTVRGRIAALPSVTPKHTEITLESALDYLHKIGWLQRHDKEMTKFALSLTPKQRTGHWIEQEGYDGDVYYDCSICGNSWTTIDGTPWQNGMNYCPNCGADMRESEEQA